MRSVALVFVAVAVVVGGCGDLSNFGGTAPPLATITITATGDFSSVRLPDSSEADLHVGLVWGEQWLPEALCFLPPESPEVAAVVAAGCRSPLSFSPARATAVAPLVPNEPVSLALTDLPAADLMVGTVAARIGFASFVIFDDRDRDGVMQLPNPQRIRGGGFEDNDGEPEPTEPPPLVTYAYGASFVAMTEPDTRLAFREGDFFESGFYPRRGCGAPLPSFSVLSAGGFSFEQAIAATVAGMLPAQDPATCSEVPAEQAAIEIPFRPHADVAEVVCEQRREDSSVRYRQPPDEAPDFADRAFACAALPDLGGDPLGPEGTVQLIVSSRTTEACKTITHFTLLGCDEDESLVCDAYEWDFRENPPSWWPCPVTR
ncbi:MAG: hypothetical protein ACKV2T_07470 [Kofleriaceae bacterium]